MNPTIAELTDKNKQQIANFLCKGKEICKKYIDIDKEIAAFQLDEVFSKWSAEKANFSSEDIANGLGAVFGDKIVRELEFKWKLVTDEHGTEYALVEEYTGSVIFPINSVWKRIEPKIDIDKFFEPMWKAVEGHVNKEKK